jgi:hypothetical protein
MTIARRSLSEILTMRLRQRVVWLSVGLICVVGVVSGVAFLAREQRPAGGRPARTGPVRVPAAERTRRRLFAEIQPVKLANCQLQRFGEDHDGGYLICGNLLGDIKAAYSYGISGYDQWGCDVATRFKVSVHEYDCFDPRAPACSTGKLLFHDECIGNSERTEDGRRFDTLERQIARNGDAGKHLFVKMDVEKAEWESLLSAPASVLERIDQMVVEFHGFDDQLCLATILKLKESFHIANLHWNNFVCDRGVPPFPSWAYEVLFVSRRIGVVEPGARWVPSPLEQPNNWELPECQGSATAPARHMSSASARRRYPE